MPRLRNKRTGVVVNVSDATATKLGAEWEPATKPANNQKPATEKTSPEKKTK